MAALPKFSFTGWSSSRISPQVNPAAVPPPTALKTAAEIRAAAQAGGFTPVPPRESLAAIQAMPGGVQAWSKAIMAGQDPGVGTLQPTAKPLSDTTSMGTGTGLVGTTNAANTNLPAWLQTEVDRINAQDALRTQLAGQVTGAPAPTQNIGDILQGVAANTAARSQFNTSLNQINEQARLQSLIQQRSQLRPTGGFGFNDPLQVPRMLDLDRQISGYRNVNLPLAAGAVGGRPSGWVNPFSVRY